jgi:hypothetical protein
MAGREKPKRKALHRGLDDIINRDASLTSRLLGRVKQPSRDSLEPSAPDERLKPGAESETSEQSEVNASDAGNSSATGKAKSATPFERPVASHQPTSIEERGPTDNLKVASSSSPSASTRPSRDESKTISKSTSPRIVPVKSIAQSFDDFVERWGFILRSGGRAGKLRICEVLYNNTYAIGKETFFTSYDKLAKLTNLEKKQCSINIRQLESLGFVERLNIFNTATKQGTEFKLHLEQLPQGERKSPDYYCYDEDLKP